MSSGIEAVSSGAGACGHITTTCASSSGVTAELTDGLHAAMSDETATRAVLVAEAKEGTR